MTTQTPGQRLYLVRLACGDGVRKAESLERFSERVLAETGEYYDPSTLSLLERSKQPWKIADADVLARVDPQGRGGAWLGFGTPPTNNAEMPDPAKDYKATEEDLDRATQAVARRAAERKSRPKGKRRGA